MKNRLPRKYKKRNKRKQWLEFEKWLKAKMVEDMHERARYIQSFPEFWKEVGEASFKHFENVKIEFVPLTEDQRKAMENLGVR